MCIDDKVFTILDQTVLVSPSHEDGIPHIHVGTTVHRRQHQEALHRLLFNQSNLH
nr:hypothetical protein Q903MT_gene2734 [Picea sitchensis]